MTLDLDELERQATWFRDECTAPISGPDPDDVLALIERVREAERRAELAETRVDIVKGAVEDMTMLVARLKGRME